MSAVPADGRWTADDLRRMNAERSADQVRERPKRGQWTADDLRRLPVTIRLETAASVLDMGLTKARELARAGQFPVLVLKHGERYVVPTQPLLALLGVETG